MFIYTHVGINRILPYVERWLSTAILPFQKNPILFRGHRRRLRLGPCGPCAADGLLVPAYPLANLHNYGKSVFEKYGKSPFLIGKAIISMAMFHSYLSLPEGEKDLNKPGWFPPPFSCLAYHFPPESAPVTTKSWSSSRLGVAQQPTASTCLTQNQVPIRFPTVSKTKKSSK